MGIPLRLILVEDSTDDAIFLVHELRRAGFEPSYVRVDTPEALLAALNDGDWDFVTSDHSMPLFNAPAALAMVKSVRPDLPVIIVSGEIDISLAVSLMREGASDYVQKHDLARLPLIFERELRESEARQERARMKETLHNYRAMIENIKDVVFYIDQHGFFSYISPSIEEIAGYKPEEIIGQPYSKFIYPADLPGLEKSLARTIDGQEDGHEFRVFTRFGQIRFVRTLSRANRDDGALVGLTGVMVDVTDYKNIEEALIEGENELRITMDSIGEAVISTDLDGKIVRLNIRAAEMTGWQSGEAEGRVLSDAVDLRISSDEADLDDYLAGLKSGEKVGRISGQGILYDRSGGERPVAFEAAPIIASDGQTRGAVLVVRDRSAELERERLLYNWVRRYENVTAASGQIAYEYHVPSGEIVWSPTIEKVLGYAQSEVRGGIEQWVDWLHPDDRERIMGTLQEAENMVSYWEAEYRMLHKEGYYVWIMDRGFFVPDENGRAEKQQGVIEDISGRRQAEEQRQLFQEEILKLNESLGRRVEERTAELQSFLYSASRDLMAPLRSVIAYAETLKRDHSATMEVEGLYCVQNILEAGNRMNALLDALLNLARISVAELQIEDCDISSIALEILENLKNTDCQRHVEWIVESDLFIKGDRRLLRIALENLLDNAWKFTDQHSSACIRIGTTVTNDRRTFVISDNGLGFDMKDSQRIFGVFQRLNPESQYSGAGVGLAIVKRIIDRHGGRIWAESQPGAGTSVYIQMPGL